MPSQKTFGRRATSLSRTVREKPAANDLAPATEALPQGNVETGPAPSELPAASDESCADVDRELEEWAAARKLQRRSFREPWRTLAIASTVGFGLSSWLLPDSVADVVELVTSGLAAASFFAGFRVRPPTQKLRSEFGD